MANGFVHAAARLVRAIQKAATRKWGFLALATLVFALSWGTLALAGLTPDAPAADASAAAVIVSANATVPQTPELPVKISIPTISLTATVANPATTNVEALDALLLHGAVRYPTSAKLGQVGNVVLFGHSSYLPVVGNPAYKTFDGIQKLKQGALITVYSSGTAYTYAVSSVTKEDASSAGIALNVSGRELTLATCDSFATKNDRFVVTADFVESHPITAS